MVQGMRPYQQQQGGDPYAAAGPAGGQAAPPAPAPELSAKPANLWGGQDGAQAFVDRIEGDKAVLLMGPKGDQEQIVHVSMLPKGAREGSWINLGGPNPYQAPTMGQTPPGMDARANYQPTPPGPIKL